MTTRRALSVLVENKPGVLTRVAGMFARRGYNIHSLAVGPTEDEHVSRMTILVGTEATHLEQVIKQLNKLINVLKIVELDPGQSVERELQMIKVSADAQDRAKIIELADVFRAKIVDVHHDCMTIEVSGDSGKLEAILDLLRPFGIREMVRTGTIAVGRGNRSITDGTKRRAPRGV